jgi:hypothetical protein
MLSGSRAATLDLGFDFGGITGRLNFFADRARLTDQCTWFKAKVGCTPMDRKNFAVQAPVCSSARFSS